MIRGISHITFIVKDLERMSRLLIEIFNAREIYDSKGRDFSLSREKFFMINDLWVAVMEGDPLPEKTYNHIAFKIADTDYDAYLSRIRSFGLEIRESRPRFEQEGRSVYFYDDDNHLFELHTGTLDQRMDLYKSADTEDPADHQLRDSNTP